MTVRQRKIYNLALDTFRDGNASFIQGDNISKNCIGKGQLLIVKYPLNQDVITPTIADIEKTPSP